MRKFLPLLILAGYAVSCTPTDYPSDHENPASFTEISTTDLGEVGAAEISAFDPQTKKLFTITNSGDLTRIEVIDLSNPAAPDHTGYIDVSAYGGNVNSVAVSEGKLAAAVEGFAKTDNGKVVVFRTSDHSVIRQVNVGAMPDMVTFSPDGKLIMTANEGEPATDYSIDPNGSISIISVKDGYHVTTLDFSPFASKKAALLAKGFRIFGPNAKFAENIEPEYVTISSDSKTAWVTLQENNGIARVDLRAKRITDIFPLGFKDYSLATNGIDPSDKDNTVNFRSVPVKGIYLPDAIAVYEKNNMPYLFTVNEGDVREWDAYVENKRLKDFTLDVTRFPNRDELRQDANLGRLNLTTVHGDTDSDGDLDELYSFGARSFSVWNGSTGKQLFDSGRELEERVVAAGKYDDGRSDDKGVEPEGITLGYVGRRVLAFVGLERADAIAIYDVTNPTSPAFVKMLATGDAPEGILFIPAGDSPSGKSLLVVSSEDDGTVKVYEAGNI